MKDDKGCSCAVRETTEDFVVSLFRLALVNEGDRTFSDRGIRSDCLHVRG